LSGAPDIPWQEKVKVYGLTALAVVAVFWFWSVVYYDDPSESGGRPSYDCEQPEPAIGDPDWHKWNNECDPPSYDDLVRWGVVDPGGAYEPDGGDYSCPAGARSC
jgi:hypothetical protein